MAAPVLIAIAYASAAEADRALGTLESLADEGALHLDDAAVVTRAEDGDVDVRQLRQLAVGEGVVSGGAIGLIAGLVFGGPILGAVAGMLGGAGWSARDTGLSDRQLARFGRHVHRGGAALFALVRDPDWPRVAGGLEPYGGEIVVSEVSASVAEALTSTRP